MFCAQCGQRVADGAKFCSNCGAPSVAVPSADVEPPRHEAKPASAPPPAAAPVPAVPPSAAQPSRPAPESAPEPRPAIAAVTGAAGGSASSGLNTGFDTAQVSAEASELARGIFARAKAIMLSPATEWPVIAAESSSARTIYLRYVAPLVAIGVIATFLGMTLIGTSLGPFGRVRTGIIAGLFQLIVTFGLSFLMVYLIALLVDILAPHFGGQRNPLAALKVTAYSFTPGWIAAIFNVIPMLAIIGVVAAFYGLYLLYLGLPVLMRCPKEKSIGYTVVLVLCAIVMSLIVSALSTCAIAGLGFIGFGALSQRAPQADSSASAGDAAGVLSNIFGGKSEADRERVSEALKTLKKAGEQSDNSAKTGGSASSGGSNAVDTAAAMSAVGQIMTGGKDIQIIDFHELKAMLPASLAGMQRTEASGQGGEAMGVKSSNATGRYTNGSGGSIRIEITDLGSMAGLAALAGKADANMEKETSTGYERTRKVDGQLTHERYDRRAKSGAVGVLVANRFSVTVEGSGVEAAALSDALKAIDLSSLAAMNTAKR
jgi:Yip1 domain/zinc-ribbon domain